MSDVSVRTAWEVLLPAGTQLMGGDAGLDRTVTWPVVLRTHPPAFDPLRGGELAIVPLDRLSLLDSALTLGRVISQLARMRIGAVCAIGAVRHDAVAAAEAAGVPLFKLPDGSNAAEVHHLFMRSLAEHRVELSQRIGDIGRELTALAIEGRGRTAIARRAGQLADAVVALEDETGQLAVLYVPPGVRIERAEATALIGQLRDNAELVLVGDDGPIGWSSGGALAPPIARVRLGASSDGLAVSALVAPIRAGQRAGGRLVMVAIGRELVGLDGAILEQTVAACAIDLAREDAATAARDEVQGDFLDDLLRGAFPSDDAIERRARNLGHDLTQPHAVLALAGARPPGPELVDPGRRDTESPPILAAVAELLAETDGVGGPVGARARGDTIVLLVPLAVGGDGPSDPGRRLAARLAELWPDDVRPSVGLGGVASGGSAIAEAAGRASQAATIGRRLFGAGSVTAFEDLGLYRLLFGLRGLEEVTRFYWDMVGTLIEHDRRTGGELLRTLDAYLSVGCSPTAAAEKLHLHRNGLLYRLQRIREIVPVNLDDPERRLALHLALRIGDVLEPAAGQVQRTA